MGEFQSVELRHDRPKRRPQRRSTYAKGPSPLHVAAAVLQIAMSGIGSFTSQFFYGACLRAGSGNLHRTISGVFA